LKVLISAFSASPTGNSEKAVGWNWAVQASRYHDVWVLTTTEDQETILEELRERPRPRLHFVFHRGPKQDFLRGLGRRKHVFFYLEYLSWQISALQAARKLHAAIGFDVTQHLTWATWRFPSALAWLDVPFIWGPVGGGETAPRSTYDPLSKRGVFGEIAREISNWMTRFEPFVRYSSARATRILTTTEETMEMLPAGRASKADVYPAIGLSVSDIERELANHPRVQTEHGEGVRLLFVGRLLAWKGCDLAIRTVAHLKTSGMKTFLTVAGDGPERHAMQVLSRHLGVESQVDFLGEVPHANVLNLYRTHDVFLFPSRHDSGGIAVLEAMYLCLPVVCLDVGGPAASVGDAGIKVQPNDAQQIVCDLAEAVERLVSEDGLRQIMTERARARVTELYDWEAKGEYIGRLYESTAN